MKSIILYPEKDKYALKRIYKIYKSLDLSADGCSLNDKWDFSYLNKLPPVLDGFSHICLILSPDSCKTQWFLYLMAYLSGSRKEALFYFTDEPCITFDTTSRSRTARCYDDVLEYLKEESLRWQLEERRVEAKNRLVDSGYALTDNAAAECVEKGNMEVLKEYLDAGFSASARNNRGVPLICLSVRNNHFDMMKSLISRGADINALSEDRNYTSLMEAASEGLVDIVNYLISEGAQLEIQSKDGQTALILAAGQGNVEISRALLKAGADYSVKDKLGMSAKSYASLFKNEEILSAMP